MKRFRDDDLILFRYGESPDAEAIRDALAEDAELARRYAELEQALASFDGIVPPEPAPAFEAELWRRLRPRLERAQPRSLWLDLAGGWRWAAAGAAALALVAGGFLVGRVAAPGPPEPTDATDSITAADAAAGLPDSARERVLLASVAGHLVSSERLLTDLVNHADAGAGEDERAFAEALLESNRLYRRAAERAGQRRIVALLDQLEPVLLELANASADLGDARRQVDDGDLLFKVRIVGGRLGSHVPAAKPLPPTANL
jgi:hypothetical protein